MTEKLLFLEFKEPGNQLLLYKYSWWVYYCGMAIYDTMQLISSPIKVVVTGMAASMGSILLSGAEKGQRVLYPHSRVLIHQPLISGQMVAVAVDIHIQAKEMEKLRDELNNILANASANHLKKFKKIQIGIFT